MPHRAPRIGALLLAGLLAVATAGCVDGGGRGWAGCETHGEHVEGSDPLVLAVIGGMLVLEAIWRACSHCR
jgi:hypothetical protein